jgi:hypothetical protein
LGRFNIDGTVTTGAIAGNTVYNYVTQTWVRRVEDKKNVEMPFLLHLLTFSLSLSLFLFLFIDGYITYWSTHYQGAVPHSFYIGKEKKER